MSERGVKAVILAGGRGARFGHETFELPKPMIRIGTMPILWHILKSYSQHGIEDFVICLGHQGHRIKEYFHHYSLHRSDVTLDLQRGTSVHEEPAEPWRITLVDTGEGTQTGGRLRRIRRHVADDALFCMTYGDGLADVDISAAIAFHRNHGRMATVTAVRPPARFGALSLEGDRVRRFAEKPASEGGFINGGFFVLSPRVLDAIEGDDTVWEREPMEGLATAGELMAFRHEGFWHPIDTPPDREHLHGLWLKDKAPWKTW